MKPPIPCHQFSIPACGDRGDDPVRHLGHKLPWNVPQGASYSTVYRRQVIPFGKGV